MEILQYGTAGFRYDSNIIIKQISKRIIYVVEHLCYENKWDNMGLMITASHNPVNDNGIKLVSPTGEMLEEKYESSIVTIINLNEKDMQNFQITCVNRKYPFELVIGFDNRPSSEIISENIIRESKNLKATIDLFGLTSTPQLHLRTKSKVNHLRDTLLLFTAIYEGKMGIYIDCANGPGCYLVEKLKKNTTYDVTIRNKDNPYLLNDKCGAEYVHKTHKFPREFEDIKPNTLCVSFDGDVDRIIFFYKDSDENFQIFDGDKIGTLIAIFIKNQIKFLNIDCKIGFVQTAYANSASTKYINEYLGIETCYTKTGVKHLHKKAKEYDIGIYFEANGHGTVLFSENILNKLRSIRNEYSRRLRNLYFLINQLVGDAFYNMLAILYILEVEDININKWNNIYTNFYSKQYKLYVNDKSIIKNNYDETKVTEPNNFQIEFDKIILKYQNHYINDQYVNYIRSFVRPSGTENCLRLYIESDIPYIVDDIYRDVKSFISELDL